MITTRVRLSHFEKMLLTELQLTEVQNGQIFDRYFGEDKLISNISRANFTYGFFDLSKAAVLFYKKLKSF